MSYDDLYVYVLLYSLLCYLKFLCNETVFNFFPFGVVDLGGQSGDKLQIVGEKQAKAPLLASENYWIYL